MTSSTAQSIHAATPSITGQPVAGDGCHATPSKRWSSLPALANLQHSSACVLRSTLTQNLPAGAIAVHVSLSVIGKNPTSGGCNEIDVNDPIVNPIGRSPASPVTIVTPVGKWPSTARKWALSNPGGPESVAVAIGGHGRSGVTWAR